MFSKTLFVFLFAFEPIFGEQSLLRPRIVGGQKTRPQEFPQMASLQYRGRHFCAASVLSSDWLLTAAHCVDASGYQNFSVVMGTNDLNRLDGATVRAPQRIVVHEKWDSKRLRFDVALIKLNAKVTLDQRVRKALLPPPGAELQEGAECVAVGWGKTSTSEYNRAVQ